jgi:hypothetical protein
MRYPRLHIAFALLSTSTSRCLAFLSAGVVCVRMKLMPSAAPAPDRIDCDSPDRGADYGQY